MMHFRCFEIKVGKSIIGFMFEKKNEMKHNIERWDWDVRKKYFLSS